MLMMRIWYLIVFAVDGWFHVMITLFAAGTLEKNAISDHAEFLGVRAYIRTSVTLWSKFGRDSAITFHGWVRFGKFFRLKLSKITGYRVQYGSR